MGHYDSLPSAQLSLGSLRGRKLSPLPFSLTLDSGFRTTWVTLKNEVRGHVRARVPHTRIDLEHRERPGFEFWGKGGVRVRGGGVLGIRIQGIRLETLKLLLEVTETPPFRHHCPGQSGDLCSTASADCP